MTPKPPNGFRSGWCDRSSSGAGRAITGIAPELPAKTETDLVVPLTTEQATLYEAVVRETMAQIADQAEGMQRRGLVLKLLTSLKQVCNHRAQFLHQKACHWPGRSGKLAALDELVDVITDEKATPLLVFTQYIANGGVDSEAHAMRSRHLLDSSSHRARCQWLHRDEMVARGSRPAP